jgi:hypothetical protein
LEADLSEKTKLGEILLEAGFIDEFQLAAALGEQSRWGDRLGETLVQLGYLSEEELVRTLTRHHGIPGVHLAGKRIEPEVLALLTVEVAERHRCIPLFKKRVGGGEVLYLGMARPEDLRIIDEVSFRAGIPVRPVLVGPIQLNTAIASFYRGEGPRPVEGEVASVLTETPVSDGDTAPLYLDPSEILSEPPARSEPRIDGEAASVLAETPVSDGETDPVFGDLSEILSEPRMDGEDGDAASRAVEGEGAAAPLSAFVEKPRHVPTRDILHALTQLLIEKGAISREELLERIAANKKRSAR